MVERGGCDFESVTCIGVGCVLDGGGVGELDVELSGRVERDGGREEQGQQHTKYDQRHILYFHDSKSIISFLPNRKTSLHHNHPPHPSPRLPEHSSGD